MEKLQLIKTHNVPWQRDAFKNEDKKRAVIEYEKQKALKLFQNSKKHNPNGDAKFELHEVTYPSRISFQVYKSSPEKKKQASKEQMIQEAMSIRPPLRK